MLFDLLLEYFPTATAEIRGANLYRCGKWMFSIDYVSKKLTAQSSTQSFTVPIVDANNGLETAVMAAASIIDLYGGIQ